MRQRAVEQKSSQTIGMKGITRLSIAVWLGMGGWFSGVAIAALPDQISLADRILPSADLAQATGDRPTTINVPALETLPRLDPQPDPQPNAGSNPGSETPQAAPSPEPTPQAIPPATPPNNPSAPSSIAPSSVAPSSVPVNVPSASPAPASNSPAPASNIIEFGQPLPL